MADWPKAVWLREIALSIGLSLRGRDFLAEADSEAKVFCGSTQFTVWIASKQEERRKQPLTAHTVPQIHLLGPQTTLLAEILQRQTETHVLLFSK